MRIAVHKALQVIAAATAVHVEPAQAFVPTGDVWIASENYVSRPADAPCSAQSLPAAALVPTGDVWITPCPAPVLSAQTPVPNSAVKSSPTRRPRRT
jgi:hypothetical protein